MRNIAVMLDLAQRLGELDAPLGARADVVLIDYPVAENIGDFLIHAGTERFLAMHGHRLIASYSGYNFDPQRNAIPAGAVILIQGGGNFGDLWPDHQALRERVVDRFAGHRIVSLPQSIHFASATACSNAMALIRSRPNVVVCARDAESAKLLHDAGIANAMLLPDMAHALWGAWLVSPATTDAALVMRRRDVERARDASVADGARDWADAWGPVDRALFRVARKLHVLDARSGNWLPASAVWRRVRDRLVARGVALLSPHATVSTDRLHVMLLALLLDRRVEVHDNSYGKLGRYIDSWLAADENLSLARAAPSPRPLARRTGRA